jgi:hypothetical protein
METPIKKKVNQSPFKVEKMMFLYFPNLYTVTIRSLSYRYLLDWSDVTVPYEYFFVQSTLLKFITKQAEKLFGCWSLEKENGPAACKEFVLLHTWVKRDEQNEYNKLSWLSVRSFQMATHNVRNDAIFAIHTLKHPKYRQSRVSQIAMVLLNPLPTQFFNHPLLIYFCGWFFL